MKQIGNKRVTAFLLAIIFAGAICTGCGISGENQNTSAETIPEFSGQPYIALNYNVPRFTEEELTICSYEHYSELDGLGRCGYAMACIGLDMMPTEDRGGIGQVKPSGWQTVKYDSVDGKYLYNRCHLIGYQLTGENANEKNLITGTRFLNVEGMLPFENMVADYIKETGNHVLYRATPIFYEAELVARGVELEAFSVEDNGDGICFYVYIYNNQPGILIDYATGKSSLEQPQQDAAGSEVSFSYILNTNTMKFHYDSCPQVSNIKEENQEIYIGDRESLLSNGYSPCKNCNP